MTQDLVPVGVNRISTKIPFSVRASDIARPLRCPVLGLRLKYGPGPRCEASASLDRVRPNAGYTVKNTVVICYRANRLKNNGSAREHRLIASFLSARGVR